MKRVNPGKQFFTEDLYSEQEETGNAFLGYHISNNFGRLMSITGTAYFQAITFYGLTSGVIAPITANFPVDNYRFVSAPVIQFWSVEDRYVNSTVFTRATTTVTPWTINGNTLHPIYSVWPQFIITQDVETFHLDPPGVPHPTSFIKVGNTSSELLPLVNFSQIRVTSYAPYTWRRNYTVGRGGVDTIPENYNAGLPIYTVGANGTSIVGLTGMSAIPTIDNKSWGVQLMANGSSVQHHPAWVEAYLDSQKLQIKWLNGKYYTITGQTSVTAGTVIFRIFGV